jgi:putative FmdB family regulatory protein
MPIFEYSCSKCGCKFEKIRKSGDGELPPCPACNATEVVKEFSLFSAGSNTSSGHTCNSGG